MTTAADSQRRTPRTVRAAVVAALDEARRAGRLQPWHEPDAAVALKLATALGKKLATGELVRLSSGLRAALASLPLRPAGEVPPADGDGVGDEPDEVDRELAEIVGSGPTVGDAAHP